MPNGWTRLFERFCLKSVSLKEKAKWKRMRELKKRNEESG
jgi:hypothetical protein